MPAIAWRPRADHPAPAGLIAAGAAARALLHELAQRDMAVMQGMTVMATRDMVILLGPAERLPWVDGVRYCAPSESAPGLWLPTYMEPAQPAELVHAALRRHTSHATMLLWPDPEMVMGLDTALPLQPAVLAWLDGALA